MGYLIPMQSAHPQYIDPRDLKETQELPIIEAREASQTNPEAEIKKAQVLIDMMLHALGGKALYRNRYSVSERSSLANYWWLLVGLGFAKKYAEGRGEISFEVTAQGVAYLKSIGALNKF